MKPGKYLNLLNVNAGPADYFNHYFIPHYSNDYRPRILHHGWLRGFTIALILVKVAVTGLLFLSFPNIGQFASITSSQIIDLTNVQRQKQGLTGLKTNSKLNQAALAKAQDMIAKNYFDHKAPDGKLPWDWITTAGYRYIYAGENLAKDFTSAQSTVAALMNSPSHRQNILNKNYTDIGVAVVDGTIDGSPSLIMVQLFGSTNQPAEKTLVESTAANKPANVQADQPTPLIYSAKLVHKQPDIVQLASGTETTIWAEFQNTGTATWMNSDDHFVALNVTDPAGRHSSFQQSNWPDYYRPVVLTAATVAPGETAKFEFTILAPNTPGSYNEHFGLVAENLTWLTGGEVIFPIIVSENTANSNQPVSGTVKSESTNSQSGGTGLEKLPVQFTNASNTGWISWLIRGSNYFYLAIFGLLALTLLTTMIVRFRHQHYPTVFRATLVIVLAALIYASHFHFLELLGKQLKLF